MLEYFKIDLKNLIKVIFLNSTLFLCNIFYEFYDNRFNDIKNELFEINKDFYILKKLVLAPFIEELFYRVFFFCYY